MAKRSQPGGWGPGGGAGVLGGQARASGGRNSRGMLGREGRGEWPSSPEGEPLRDQGVGNPGGVQMGTLRSVRGLGSHGSGPPTSPGPHLAHQEPRPSGGQPGRGPRDARPAPTFPHPGLPPASASSRAASRACGLFTSDRDRSPLLLTGSRRPRAGSRRGALWTQMRLWRHGFRGRS